MEVAGHPLIEGPKGRLLWRQLDDTGHGAPSHEVLPRFPHRPVSYNINVKLLCVLKDIPAHSFEHYLTIFIVVKHGYKMSSFHVKKINFICIVGQRQALSAKCRLLIFLLIKV